MARPRKGITDADRILAKITIDPGTGCWEWQGYRQPGGYGRTRSCGRKVLVHRWVFEHLVGPIPEGLTLDHLCRNPACCNPDHLEPVTQRVNTLRGIGQGALNAVKVECPKGHPYSAANTYVDFLGRRVCRTCRTEWNRAYRRKQRNPTDPGPDSPSPVSGPVAASSVPDGSTGGTPPTAPPTENRESA
jgi:hypothetical protein